MEFARAEACNPLDAFRQRGLHETFGDGGSAALRCESRRKTGQRTHHSARSCLPEVLRRRDRKSLRCIFECTIKQRCPRLPATPYCPADLISLIPGVDGRGRGDRGRRPAQRNRIAERRQLRRSLADTRYRAQHPLPIADHPESVAAESGEMRIRHAERCADGDRGFDRVAARTQYVEVRGASNYVRAGDHAGVRTGESGVVHRYSATGDEQ